MMGDDYADAWPGVKAAVDEFVEKMGLELRTEGVKWWVRKPK